MIDLTWTNGQKIQIDGKDVLRIRKTYPNLEAAGKSLVTWLQSDIFEEEPSWIASKTSAELATLTTVNAPDGSPIWFNGAKSMGPIYVVPANRMGGIASSLAIGNNIQYVANTPEEVAAIVKASGGRVMPIRQDITPNAVLPEEHSNSGNELRVWDLNILRLNIPGFVR
jgi:hypothetical protein